MLKIGHRGARAYEPENTIRSFRKALELGVDAIELDVRKTKDDAIVVIHDADVSRTTNGKGSINQLTLQEVKQLTTKKSEKIPLLEEALDFLDKRVKILIELKEFGIEEKVLNIIRRKGLEHNVIIISFLEDALRKIRTLDGAIEIGLIYVRYKNPIKLALEIKASYLISLYRFTHSVDIKKAHKSGLKVIVWTINKQDEVLEYVKKGVDGITSDKPDILNF